MILYSIVLMSFSIDNNSTTNDTPGTGGAATSLQLKNQMYAHTLSRRFSILVYSAAERRIRVLSFPLTGLCND